MSVYLDPMVNWGKRIGRAGPMWCHMISDNLGELHAMAARIGLRREWFQAHPKMPHYDIGTPSKRAAGVAAGAVECDRRTFTEHNRRIRGATP